jgi:hypothetical protein
MDDNDLLLIGVGGLAALAVCTRTGRRIVSEVLTVALNMRPCNHGIVEVMHDKSVYCIRCKTKLPKLSRGKVVSRRIK